MKFILVLLLSIYIVGCSSANKKEAADKAKDDMSESTREAVEDVTESVGSVVDESVNSGVSCPVKVNNLNIDFGSQKVTSRAYRRLRLRAATEFRVTGVSSFEKPFDFYNSGEFPGEATYHGYELCSQSQDTTKCSLNLEFRPTAISSYESRLTISYIDSKGDNCSLNVTLTGTSTESYLGDDNTN